MTTLKTIIHAYNFDVSIEEERSRYDRLMKLLQDEGMTKSRTLQFQGGDFRRKHILPLDGKEIALETDYIFDNQWNTAATETSECGLRVFDWDELICENRNYKAGYYLELTDEMRRIRKDRYKCGFCGAQYDLPTEKFCRKCLSSRYLKESELYLLRLLPVGDRQDRAPLTDEEERELINAYIEAQVPVKKDKEEEFRDRVLKRFKRKVENAKTEKDGFLWLLNNGIDIDDCLYYEHTRLFGFGWRSGVSPEVEKRLRYELSGFPFEYTIRMEKGY